MTTRSPRSLRIFVTRTGPSDSADDVARALDTLRFGVSQRATVGAGSLNDCLVLEAGRVARPGALAEVRGFAQTDGPSDEDDLQPARALRRALAYGRLNAAAIGYACAFEMRAADQTRALQALGRGLGKYAPAIDLETADDPLARAVAAVSRGGQSVAAALALVIDPEVGSIALAFGRP